MNGEWLWFVTLLDNLRIAGFQVVLNDSVVVVNPLGEDLFTADELRTSQLEALVNDVKAITDDRSKDKDASEETLAKIEREVRMPSSFFSFLFLFFFSLLPVRTFVLLFEVVCPKKTLKPGAPSFVRCASRLHCTRRDSHVPSRSFQSLNRLSRASKQSTCESHMTLSPLILTSLPLFFSSPLPYFSKLSMRIKRAFAANATQLPLAKC
jgi:hypothetical protein